MSQIDVKNQRRVVWGALLVALLAMNYYWFKSPITIGFDPNDERCLPDVHVALLVKQSTARAERGDLFYWEPSGALSQIKQAYILKRVSGVPGDRLQIKGTDVLINGEVVAQGLPLVDTTKVPLNAFERDEVIPDGKFFMTGTHPLSNDSRYWGYLESAAVVGKGYKIF